MVNLEILEEQLKENNIILEESFKEKVISNLKKQQMQIQINIQEIVKKLRSLQEIDNKGTLLLEFRRVLERYLRTPLILVARNIYDDKIVAIDNENVIFYLDERYYHLFELVSFMDIFKIETNDYKKIFWSNNSEIQPHLGQILTYIKDNYNSTYRFFRNRNVEYHYIYSMFYYLNDEFREMIGYLNAYHFRIDEDNLELYNVSIDRIKEKLAYIIKAIQNISKKFDKVQNMCYNNYII